MQSETSEGDPAVYSSDKCLTRLEVYTYLYFIARNQIYFPKGFFCGCLDNDPEGRGLRDALAHSWI